MTEITPVYCSRYNHWDEKDLKGYIYANILSDQIFSQLTKSLVAHLDGGVTRSTNYGTHRTTFSFSNSSHAVVKHHQNARDQQIIFDLTMQKEWWYQSVDSVHAWSNNWIKNNVSPVFCQFIHKMYLLPPFSEEPVNWIPYRWHINVLEYDKFLTMHTDTDPKYFKDGSTRTSRIISLTYYLEDYVEGHGGDLYTLSGFTYKPQKNSAIGFNGHQVSHGVNANLKPSKEPRLAFTMRWAHKEDLYLPGSPEKSIFKLEW